MQINQTRFITACQQSLAVGVVVALLVPAANVLSLDIVSSAPGAGAATTSTAVTAAAVPVASVEPEIAEYELNAVEPASPGASVENDPAEQHTHDDHTHEDHTHGLAVDVAPEDVVAAEVAAPVEGYGAVGITWDGDARVASGELAVQVRTREGEEWSPWSDVPYSDDHAPDAGSPDALSTRGGTEPVIVGAVDEVEVRAEGAGDLPADLQLSVVDPGTAATRTEAPTITATEAGAKRSTRTEAAEAAAQAEAGAETTQDMVLQSSVTAPRPTIYSRAQWGADEKLRDKSSLRYGTINAGFVHHTVNANNYTADEVPGILRSIYAYHTKSRGWSDVGYNFLVDRFGRIWEGRAGGVDKAVIGAHTLGYNEYSFAMSAIGNFETAAPSQAMVDAYGSLMAWKLGLHGVKASSTRQKVGKGTFAAINGHRDAGSTACPGKNLYSKIGEIRTRAASLQGTSAPAPDPQPEPEKPQFGTPVMQSNLLGTPHPDILVRRASDKRLMVIPTGGLSELAKPTTLISGWRSSSRGFLTQDMSGDGKSDLVAVVADGSIKVRPGNGKGKFSSKGTTQHKQTRKHSMLTAAGDLDRNGRGDLVGRDAQGTAVAFLRTRAGGFKKVTLNRTWKTIASVHAVGDITGDGYPDLVGRRAGKKGTPLLIRSTGKLTFAQPVNLPGDWSQLEDFVGGVVDFDRDGQKDLVFRNKDGNVWVLPGLGNATFDAPLGPIATNISVTQLSIAPIHGNEFPDVLARSGKKVLVLKNTGKFEIGAPISLKIAMPSAIQVFNGGDWNRDGKGDVMAVRSNGELIVRTGNGMGSLSASTVIGTGFSKVTGLQAVGDVTGDGFPDLVGTKDKVTTIYPGQALKKMLAPIPAPSFKAPLARLAKKSGYDATKYDWKIPVSDVRLAKGTTDLVVRERRSNRLHVFENTSNGFGPRRYLGRGLGAFDLAG